MAADFEALDGGVLFMRPNSSLLLFNHLQMVGCVSVLWSLADGWSWPQNAVRLLSANRLLLPSGFLTAVRPLTDPSSAAGGGPTTSTVSVNEQTGASWREVDFPGSHHLQVCSLLF